MKDRELLKAIKEKLAEIAKTDPQWRLIRGREVLSAADILQRLDKDKKLRQFLMAGSVGVAVEMWGKGTKK